MNSDRPSLARAATELLALELHPTPAPSAMQRARAIAQIAATIELEGRRRRRRRLAVAGAGALVAAAAALVFVARPRPHPSAAVASAPITASAHALAGDVELDHGGRRARLDDALPIEAGDRVLAGDDARATIALSTGTHVIVEAGGDVLVVEQDATQIYALRAGALQADVAKLGKGERFLVRTVDAEVEVRGTSFHLALVTADPRCGAGSRTRLVVAEGVVVVRSGGREEAIAAGHSWPTCAAAVGSEPPSQAAAALPIAPPPPAPSVHPASKLPLLPAATVGNATGKSALTPSELAAQNDLFARATDARNVGDAAGALAGYERYLAKYPNGALEENATVERMRLLARLDPRRGALAAKAYLARHPGGFARAEAEGLAAEVP